MVTSTAVLEELRGGDFESQEDCLSLLDSVPLLPTETGIGEIIRAVNVLLGLYVPSLVTPLELLGGACPVLS